MQNSEKPMNTGDGRHAAATIRSLPHPCERRCATETYAQHTVDHRVTNRSADNISDGQRVRQRDSQIGAQLRVTQPSSGGGGGPANEAHRCSLATLCWRETSDETTERNTDNRWRTGRLRWRRLTHRPHHIDTDAPTTRRHRPLLRTPGV